MNVNQDLVQELCRRVRISYEEAEKWLKRTNGDINLAAKGIREKQKSEESKSKNKFLQYRFLLRSDDKNLIDLPMWVTMLLFIFIILSKAPAAVVLLVFVGFILITGNEIIITYKNTSSQVDDSFEMNNKSNNQENLKYARKAFDQEEFKEKNRDGNQVNGYYEKEISGEMVNKVTIVGSQLDISKEKLDTNKNDAYYEITIED